ncbi:iron-sulfur cluster repair di-iron protein, partial [Oleiphilus sp. HI0069]
MPDQTLTDGNSTLEPLESLSNPELIAHILQRYHEVHRQQLSELNEKAARVESVHGEHPECPHGLSNHLQTMKIELEQHMFKEENILFPMLEQGMGAMAQGPISVMRHEHDEHAGAISQLSELTNQLTLPEDACNTWTRLYALISEFIEDLQSHISIENNLLF